VLGLGSVLTGALAVTLLVLGPVLGSEITWLTNAGLDTNGALWTWLRWPVAFGALVIWATTMQHLAPPERHRWRQDIPGGLLTALLWLAASAGLNIYLTFVVTASPLLGALGGGLILMSWFYLLCVALLAGATLNAVLAARRTWRRQSSALASDAMEPREDVEHGDEQPPGRQPAAPVGVTAIVPEPEPTARQRPPAYLRRAR
jgi:membrane protein